MATPFLDYLPGGLELNYVISCVWCNGQTLTQLVQFGCFHVCCKPCLQYKLEDPKPGVIFNCPECDMSCMVPIKGIDNLPDEPLQHRMNHIAMIFSNNKPNCKLCELVDEESSISSVCITCQIHLCERDAKRHQGTPGHNVVTHGELCEEANLSLMLRTKSDICPEHSLDKKYFCRKCQFKICSDCGMSNHSNHKKDPVKNVAMEYRKILDAKLEGVVKHRRTVKENVEKLETKLQEIQENHSKSLDKYQNEKTPERILTESFRRIAKESKQMKLQIEEETNNIKQCNSAECYMKVFLKFSSDADVIEKFQDFISNLELCEMHERKAEILMEKSQECPKKEMMHTLSTRMVGVGLNQIGRKKSFERRSMSQSVLEAKWKTVWWPGVAVYEEELLVVSDQKMKWFKVNGKSGKKIVCKDLEKAGDVEVFKGELYVTDRVKREVLVIDMKGKVVRKMCLPEQERGLSGELGIAINTQCRDVYVCSKKTNAIYKCPIESKVFVPWITSGLNEPCYLCVGPDQQLIVSNAGSNSVCLFNSQGDLVWTYGSGGSGEGQLSFPHGVCTDPWGHIFIADYSNHRIVLLSNEGLFMSYIGTAEKIMLPLAVSFGNERLVITTSSMIYVLRCYYM